MKAEFVATVSHELRTPITSIRVALGRDCRAAVTDRWSKRRANLVEIVAALNATPIALWRHLD